MYVGIPTKGVENEKSFVAAELEVLGITENRYSGIPTIQRSMKEYGGKEP